MATHWVPDSGKNKYITYSGALPERLYRYRTVTDTNLDRIIDFEILEDGLYLAALHQLNDPDEGRFTLTFGTDTQKILAYWLKALASQYPDAPFYTLYTEAQERTAELVRDNFSISTETLEHLRAGFEKLIRVVCFTTEPLNYAMWANYGGYTSNNGATTPHGGICLEYECTEDWRKTTLHPVDYHSEIPTISVVDDPEPSVVRSIYLKSVEWQCEHEWRITAVLHPPDATHPSLDRNSKMRLPGTVKSVIFGQKASDKLISTVRDNITKQNRHLSLFKVGKNIRNSQRMLVKL